MLSTTYNKEERLWYGSDAPPSYNPKISLAQALLHSMNIFGSKKTQICDDNGYGMSFSELHTKSVRAAQNLQSLGYKRKEVFGIVARFSHSVTPIIVASIFIGCPVNPLNPSYGKRELLHMLSITKPSLMFCDTECCELVRNCLDELSNPAKIFTFGETVGESESVEILFNETRIERNFSPVTVDGSNETALMICTSGTTGMSKVARWSHAAILHEINQFCGFLRSEDVILCFGMLFLPHCSVTLLQGILGGGTRIFTSKYFSPNEQIRLIQKYKVTFSVNAPHEIALMMECDRFNEANLSSMKYQLIGGGGIPLHMRHALRKHLPNGNVVVTYGMTEFSGPVAIDYPATYDRDSNGRLVNGCRVKIVDERGNQCGVNEKGKIHVKTKYRFLGYVGNQQATAVVFDDEGFLITGDIGYFDDEGNLFIVGREKDQLKYGGCHISPCEIETYLSESEDIQMVCVVGIPDRMGDMPAAVIVRAEGSTISEKEVYDMVAEHFADHCKLRGGVYFIDSILRTASSKIIRSKVKEIAVDMFKARKL